MPLLLVGLIGAAVGVGVYEIWIRPSLAAAPSPAPPPQPFPSALGDLQSTRTDSSQGAQVAGVQSLAEAAAAQARTQGVRR